MAEQSSTKDVTEHEKEQQLTQARNCLNIIIFKPNGQKYHNAREARANPNRRLVEVFGVDNVFTSTKPTKFSVETIKKMKAACNITKNDKKGDWSSLRTRALQYHGEYMERVEKHGSINLADMVRYLTLKLSLSYLFDGAAAAFKSQDTFKDIKSIGFQINKLWIDSKKPDGERPHWEDQIALHEALRNVTTIIKPKLPGTFIEDNVVEPTVPSQNPINFLLPAYETM